MIIGDDGVVSHVNFRCGNPIRHGVISGSKKPREEKPPGDRRNVPQNSTRTDLTFFHHELPDAPPSFFEGWDSTSACRVAFFAYGRNLTSALFHHEPSARIIDYQPATGDNKDSDWGSFEGRPSTRDGPRNCPKAVSALFDNLSPYSGILYYKSFRINDQVRKFPLTL